ETLVVEQFEQRREALRVAVVRRGGQEELVFKMRHQEAKSLRAERVGSVAAPTRWGTVMCLIYEKQVELPGIRRFVRPRQHFTKQQQRSIPLEEVDGRDEPGEVVPRIDVDASLAAKLPHQVAVHDAEVEAELVPHLLFPLDLQRGRADNKNFAGAVPDDEFE